MVDVVESTLDIRIDHPNLAAFGGGEPDGLDGVMGAATGTEAVRSDFELRFPLGFQGVLDARLEGAVTDGWDTERSLFAVGFRNVDAPGWGGSPRLCLSELVNQSSAGLGSLDDHLVHAGRLLTSVLLRYPPNAQESVRVASQEKFLEAPDLA